MRSGLAWGQLQDLAWCSASSRSSLVLLGDVGTGKSRLVLRFVKVQFVEFQESTIGAAFFSQTLAIRSSLKSGTRPARRGTTAWHPCTSPTRSAVDATMEPNSATALREAITPRPAPRPCCSMPPRI